MHRAGKGLQTQADVKQGVCKACQRLCSEFWSLVSCLASHAAAPAGEGAPQELKAGEGRSEVS